MTTPSPPPAADRPSILIVDDNPSNLLALDAVLGPLGYDLVTANSGGEALLKTLRQDFVLILMDVQMPDLDGYQTVEMLRQRSRTSEVPIIFLTAFYSLDEHAHRGYALGAADYVTKPFDPVVVRAKVSALVGLYTRGRLEEQKRGVEMDRLKDLLLGAIGHDLRNPLQSFALGIEVVAKESDADNRARQLGTMRRSARRMTALVEHILDLTSGKFTGGISLRREAADLAAICRQIVEEMKSAHAARSILLDITGDVTGEWDIARVGRIVGNLVSNAIHHARESSVRIRVVGEGDSVTVEVSNDGPGIPKDLLPLLFEPFRRGKTSAEGFGLGLYIVREVTVAHGGIVGVRSSDAEGTTFTVTLPRRPAPNAAPG